MIKGTLTLMHINPNPVKVNSRKQSMDNKSFLKNTTSLPMSKAEVKVILDGNLTMQPSIVRSLEMDRDKTKNHEQLTLVQKKKTRRRNRKKKSIVLQNSTLVQELSEVDCLTCDNDMSTLFSTLSLYNERNTKAAVNSSIKEGNNDAGFFRTSFPRLPFSRSRKKLLILDINGLLADIVSPPPKEYKADTKIARRASENCLIDLLHCFFVY